MPPQAGEQQGAVGRSSADPERESGPDSSTGPALSPRAGDAPDAPRRPDAPDEAPSSRAPEPDAPEENATPAGADAPDDGDKSRAMRMAEQLGERRERHKRRGTLYRIAITVAGFLLVLTGIVLSGPGVPGPGFLVILIGLALLALEFAWAERLLRRGLDYADRAGARASRMSTRRKVVIGILTVAAIAAAVGAVFVFDIPVPFLND